MEIFKSPAPLQFGSGYALVNVQPKKMTDEGTMGNTGLSVGSHQSVDENVAVGYKSGNFDIYAAQSWLSTKGHREHSRANQANYYVNMGYKFIDQWEVRLILNRVDAQTQYPRAENDNSDETLPRYDTTTTFSTLSLNNSYDWAEGYLKFYWNDTKFEILNENAGAANSEQKVKLYGFRAREDFHIWKGSEIRFGFDLDRQVLDNYQRFVNGDPVKHWNFPEITLFSPYAGISQMFGDQDGWYIKPNAGLRLYVNNEFKNKVAPEASLTLGYKDTSLIFNYARGVNYPSPVILQAGILNPDFKWEGIKPEIVDHYELTLSHNIRDRFVASLSAFYDEGKDRFRAYMFGPSPTVWNDPVGKYEIKGLEFAVTAKPLDNLELFGSATWMKAKARGSNGVTAGDWVDHLPYTPEFMFKAGVDWRVFEAVRFYADIQHMQGLYGGNTMRPAGFGISNATQKLDNITLVNARLSYGFNYSPLRIKDSEVFVSVNNLFNKKYQYVVGYPMPGTTFMIGTNIQFR